MNRASILFLLLFLQFNIGFGQKIDVASERILTYKSISAKSDANGSPYINEKFEAVNINNKVYSARFNAFNREMEVKLMQDKIIALDNNGEFEVTFNRERKVYKTFDYTDDDDKEKREFLVVVKSKDDFSLLQEETIKYNPKVEARSSYQQAKPAFFKRDSDKYYILTKDKVAFLPQNKKELFKMFPEKSDDLKALIKKEKIRFKDQTDVIKIFDFLSS